jgi:Protein of unknown function (DUF1488)
VGITFDPRASFVFGSDMVRIGANVDGRPAEVFISWEALMARFGAKGAASEEAALRIVGENRAGVEAAARESVERDGFPHGGQVRIFA